MEIGDGETKALCSPLPFFPRVFSRVTCRLPGRHPANAHRACMSGYGFGKWHRSHCQLWDLGNRDVARTAPAERDKPPRAGLCPPGAHHHHPQAVSLHQCQPNPSLGARSPWAELLLPRKKHPRAGEKGKRPNLHSQPLWHCDPACHPPSALIWVWLSLERELPNLPW